MEKLEKNILLKAHQNHLQENRSPAHWRVIIRAFITQDPVELSERRISGIY